MWKEKSVATVGLSKRTVHIDFGVVEIDQDGTFAEWKEKPTIDYLVSMGIYLLEPEALDMMVDEVFFTLPELIVKLHENGRKVTGFVHEGYWLDIGRPEDYEKACRDYEDELCDKI
ncbi:MAG: sugar phosphate nucleotidyltransferase [Phycisphaerae bacterium]|nr:sugar phosphate nucleotidyltransferase [Phycisphaerae bacterium]